jgi:hypothetical protein
VGNAPQAWGRALTLVLSRGQTEKLNVETNIKLLQFLRFMAAAWSMVAHEYTI